MLKPKRRQIDPEEKMGRVLRVARDLFVEKGYHNVTIPAIVKASGVSTGAIYSYFTNKESLARHIHEDTMHDFQSMLQERLDDVSSIRGKLEAFGTLCFDITESDPVMMEYLLYMKHSEFMSDTVPICFSEPFKMVRQVIVEGIESGDIRQQDVFVAAISYTGVIIRAIELKLMCVVSADLHDLSADLLQNAWAAVRNA
ncbi:MAG: TetR/AcrR family transcriptional regulator [Desulfuromonadaceae bacterium]|nr:TetR/AcrR family transcriptional regulator [Desulfuromonas sp.]MDY0186050.1 TetR/AcrR family transcriptional regulator [Desulfuromonadaceae bacterium]